MSQTLSLGITIEVAVVLFHIHMDVRHSSITYAAEAEKYTAETGETGTTRFGGQAETTDSEEETVGIVGVTGTPPNSHTPNTDSGNSAENTPTVTEVSRLER